MVLYILKVKGIPLKFKAIYSLFLSLRYILSSLFNKYNEGLYIFNSILSNFVFYTINCELILDFSFF